MNLDPEPLQNWPLGGGHWQKLAGHAMGFRFMVLEPNPDCPAALQELNKLLQVTLTLKRCKISRFMSTCYLRV